MPLDITSSSLSSESSRSSLSSRTSLSSKSSSSISLLSASSLSSSSSSNTVSSFSSSSSSNTILSSSSLSSESSTKSSRSSSSSISSSSSQSSSSSTSSQSSSLSTQSSSVSSQSSISSKSSKSSSSSEWMTSASSSSTLQLDTSSSVSSESSYSSSSSAMRGTVTMAFRAEGIDSQNVWCFASRSWGESSSSEDGVSRTVYAGTGPEGLVLYSKDFYEWNTFMTVGDCHAKSMIVWANALFVGTQPKGRIYTHNFSSGQEYLFVETEDSSVTAFAEYQNKLYAGTSPAGIVYSFDGIVWKEEHRPYGGGVTSMSVSDNLLYVFSSASEGPVVYDGTKWRTYPEKKADESGKTPKTVPTVASTRIVSGGIFGTTSQSAIDPTKIVSDRILGQSTADIQEARPTNPQFNVTSSAVTEYGLAFGGLDNGVVLTASDNSFSKLLDIGSPVNVISNVGNNVIMVASGGKVYLAKTKS